jgi:hypothetical protein
MGYIEGSSRKQTVIFLDVIDDYVKDDIEDSNHVSFIDKFVKFYYLLEKIENLILCLTQTYTLQAFPLVLRDITPFGRNIVCAGIV